jgi:CubicO group peptidase (beta-lactamase class C family)
MEHDGVWQALVPGEVEMGGHGFNATLRDWGRFALFVAHGGTLSDGTPLLPTDWLEAATTWTQAEGSVTPATPAGQFGYQWWHLGIDPALHPTPTMVASTHRVFWAQGIYGQNLAIDRTEDLVMVQWSAWEQAEKPDALYDEQAVFFSALEKAFASQR